MLRPYTDNQHNNTKTINFCIDNDLDINFMLHSSELALGCSPISMNSENQKKIWNNIENTFKYINSKKIKSMGISKIANANSK